MKAFNANGSTFKFGDPRVADVNGDGKINAERPHVRRRQLSGMDGQLVEPRHAGSGWDISALVTAKWNYTFVDGTPRSYFGRFNNVADLDYWTPTNPTNKNPAPTTGARGPPVRVDAPLHATARTGASATSRRATRSTAASRTGSVSQSVRLYGTAQDPYIHSELHRHRSGSRRRGADDSRRS